MILRRYTLRRRLWCMVCLHRPRTVRIHGTAYEIVW